MVIKTATIERFTTMRKNKTHLPIIQRNMVVINTVNSVEGTGLENIDTVNMAEGTDLANMDTVNMVEDTIHNMARSAENSKDTVMEKAKFTMTDKNTIHKLLQGGKERHLEWI